MGYRWLSILGYLAQERINMLSMGMKIHYHSRMRKSDFEKHLDKPLHCRLDRN